MSLTDRQMDYVIQAAYKLGTEAGKNAAGWGIQDAIGGRVGDTAKAQESARIYLKGIEDGDPAVLDQLPFLDLSGQWADGPSPSDIVAEILSEA